MLQVGDPFPAFSLSDQDGQIHTQEELKGAVSVVYFYPKDDTSGCTAQACEFQARLPDVPGARVFGVSPDGVRSHRKFADKYGLSFTLLADEDHALAEACGVWAKKSMYGREYMGVARTTFVVDAEGRVARVWPGVKPKGHAATVVAALRG